MATYKRLVVSSMVDGALVNGIGTVHTIPATSTVTYHDTLKVSAFNTLGSSSVVELNILSGAINPNADNVVKSVSSQSDGKVLVGGSFGSVGGVTRVRAARVFDNGALDTTFNPVSMDGGLESIFQQSDGKILLGGLFSTVGGVARSNVARLFDNGALDTTFDPNANSFVDTFDQQSDGKILLGGRFNTVGGVSRTALARVFDNGALDTTFNASITNTIVNATATVWSVEVTPDGKVLLGGYFTAVGGTARNNIARVFVNSVLDTTFNPNANGPVLSAVRQSDGKVLLGGDFTTVGATARNYIARVFDNGALDTTFNPNANSSVYSVVQQPDGKILLGGSFTAVGGVTRNYIARVFDNGALDTTFNPDANGSVESIAIQSNGNITLGGYFTTIGGASRNYLATLTSIGRPTGYIGSVRTTVPANSKKTIDNVYIKSTTNDVVVSASASSGVYLTGHVDRVEE